MRLAVLGLGASWPVATRAQLVNQYFPIGVPGYGEQTGVTVASRLRTLYEPQGIHVGDFLLNSDLAESVGYNSNVAGFSNSPGSGFVQTAPSASFTSDWGRNQLGAAVTATSTQYFSQARQNTTDWTASLGGGYEIGREKLVAGYSHLSLYELPNEIGTSLSTTPIPYSVDDARVFYTFDAGRFSFIPRVDVQIYQYGNATVSGLPVSQSFDNRVNTTGSLQTRYALSDQRSLIFVVEGVDSSYTNVPAGQPTSNSQSVLALGGLDYQADGVWRYTALFGVERRSFQASQFTSHTAPIAAVSVTWTPTGLTTVTGLLSRTIEDPTQQGTAGYTYTQGSVVVDHEYLRNVLLQGKVGLEAANYLQSGSTQTSYTLGAGAQWLLNRHMRLGLTYTFTQQTGSSNTNGNAQSAALGGFTFGNYNQNVVMLTFRVSL